MTDTEKELNEKLAKFAGFYYFDLQVVLASPKDVAEERYRKPGCYYPDGSNCYELPGFLNSLSTCFKWLMPKLKRWEAGNNEDGSIWFRCALPDTTFPAEARAETLSLALCLAIEKLIDAEVK